MSVRPLRDRVLVQLAASDAPTAGLIQVARLSKQPSMRATVLSVGPEVREVDVGDAVVVSRLQGVEIGDGAVLLPESAVLAHDTEADNFSEPIPGVEA